MKTLLTLLLCLATNFSYASSNSRYDGGAKPPATPKEGDNRFADDPDLGQTRPELNDADNSGGGIGRIQEANLDVIRMDGVEFGDDDLTITNQVENSSAGAAALSVLNGGVIIKRDSPTVVLRPVPVSIDGDPAGGAGKLLMSPTDPQPVVSEDSVVFSEGDSAGSSDKLLASSVQMAAPKVPTGPEEIPKGNERTVLMDGRGVGLIDDNTGRLAINDGPGDVIITMLPDGTYAPVTTQAALIALHSVNSVDWKVGLRNIDPEAALAAAGVIALIWTVKKYAHPVTAFFAALGLGGVAQASEYCSVYDYEDGLERFMSLDTEEQLHEMSRCAVVATRVMKMSAELEAASN